jgi:hypothetical protein
MTVRPRIAASDFDPLSVHPRESGEPEQLPGHVMCPWVPAFAGTNGREYAPFRAGDCDPHSVHPRESGELEQLPGHVMCPFVPAFAGTNGREYAPFRAGDCDPHSVHPRGSGEPEMCRTRATKIRSSPRTRGPRSTQSDSHIPGWIPASAGMNGVGLGITPSPVRPRASGDPRPRDLTCPFFWIPAFAGMNGVRGTLLSSSIAPHEAGA